MIGTIHHSLFRHRKTSNSFTVELLEIIFLNHFLNIQLCLVKNIKILNKSGFMGLNLLGYY